MSETPRRLGRYELVRRIAVGGMGEIYLARAEGTAGFEKTVIIKTILPHLAEEDEFVEKFLDEGRIVVNLTHGNIVSVFDMDEEDGEYFIAMEYVPGRDLREVLARLRERGERMSPDLAAYIASEVCEGLGYAHTKTDDQGNPLDIVHRDVSPSNVLISTEGEVKIIDFGVARAADRRAKTVSGRIQGKCCYMSPEQAKGESLDHRSDIFSTGSVLYEMLTCVRPFEGASDLKSLDLVRDCEFDAPSVVEPTVPEELDGVVERALAERPEDRYQQIDEMKVDLMEFLVSRGRAVTSEEVAEFLSDLFPEGLEREDFREVREQADEPSGPMELDDALEYQLDQMDDNEVSPLGETLPGDDEDQLEVGEMGRTETITPESGLEEDPEGESDEEGTGDGEPGGPTSPERPAAEQAPERRAGAEAGTTRPDRDGGDERAVPFGWWTWGAAIVAVAVAAGAFVFAGDSSPATVSVRTDPAGARIVVDGSRVGDRTTPAELELRPGEHTLELRKEGFRRERRELDLSADERKSYQIDLVDQKPEERSTREFVVETVPAGGRIWVNQRERGEAPKVVELAPGETKFVAAEKEGCRGGQLPVYYGREDEVVRIRLECGRPDVGGEQATAPAGSSEEAGDDAPDPTPQRTPPPHVELRFRSSPSGANVEIDGKSLGETPVAMEVDRDEEARVRFSKSGYETVEKTIEVANYADRPVRVELSKQKTGCLDFFAVHPQYNEIAIDGEWLEGRRQKLRDYELPVGEHEIRVRNPNAGKDETFTFEIEPGEKCTSLTVWDPDEG